jgi:probable rRNA maturation factor
LNVQLLRRIARYLFATLLPSEPYELCLHLVDAVEMERLNDKFLDHIGPTDVITFDHRQLESNPNAHLHGEIFICVDVAIKQAREFETTWKQEVVRYLVHGALHLHGHDDHDAPLRRVMKRAEDKFLGELSARFAIAAL